MIDQRYDLIGGKQTVWAAIDAFYRQVLDDAE
jgi:truncated hemoglobin YjbI